MEGNYIEEGKNRFLRLPRSSDSVYSYEQKMILNNQPPGLLTLHMAETAEGCFYEYNVSGLTALSDCTEEELQGSYLKSILFHLEKLAGEIQEYMLIPGHLDISEKGIFLRRESGQIYFLYYPDKTESFRDSLCRLMEYFLKRLNPTEEKEILLLYGLYSKSREPNVTMGTLAEYWRGSEEEPMDFSADLPEPGEEKRELYRDLGIQEPGKTKRAEISEWRLEQENQDLPEIYDEVIYSGEESSGKKFIAGAGRFFRDYAFEIAVGAVVLAGTVLILLR